MLNKDAEMRIRDYLASPFWGISGLIRLLNELSSENMLEELKRGD